MNVFPSESLRSATGFRWDAFDAYLFDIDGTLLNCRDAVHYFAFLDCLCGLSGRSINLEGVTTHGSTDPRILIDALTLAGVPGSQWREQMPAALAAMAAQVSENQARMRVEVLPKVRELLQLLKAQGATLGVATGNLEAIGWIKLEVAGLRGNFQFGAFSDGPQRSGDIFHSYRADIFRRAGQQALDIAGPETSVCAVGDTPADILAAREVGVPVIAVATGIYDYRELAELHPDLCLHSFAELFPGETG